ncbi:MAG: hypothetical protein WD847_04390 [Pirellulales bacterium]
MSVLDETIKQLLDDPALAAERLGLAAPYKAVVEATGKLFPGACTVSIEDDPEIPDDFRIVFRVRASGSDEGVLERELEWCRQVSSLNLPGVFRLSIEPQA